FDVRYRFTSRVSIVVIPEPIARRRFADLDGPIRSAPLGPLGFALLSQLAAVKRSARSLTVDAAPGDVVLGRLLDSVLDALADQLGADRGRRPVAIRAAAERMTERELRDPRLDASYLAARLGVSLRTLH